MAFLPRSRARALALVLLAIAMVGAGSNHFVAPDFYLPMMPPWLPWHAELVAISGVFEVLGGLGVLLPQTRRFAGWGLIALLIAVYPANLHMALHPELFVARGFPLAGLYIRLPFQFLFILWAWWATLPDDDA